MASLDNLTTDSLPDPPRAEIPPDDHNRDSKRVDEKHCQEDFGKERHNGKKSPTNQERRRSSNSIPQSPLNFNIPGINAPAGAGSVICINNASKVQLGNNYHINVVGQAFPQSCSSKSPSPEPRSLEKPKKVKDACKSTTTVSNSDIDNVTEHVGKRWVKLGERLGYSEEQMERFHEDNHEMGLKEVVYQMLLDWKQSKGPEAHVGVLCRHLWSARLYVAAEQLAEQHSGKSL